MKLLLGATGSVASIKLKELLVELRERIPDIEIRIVLTEHAKWFVSPDDLHGESVYSDDSEWKLWKQKGDPVLHIELRKWADILLIAPLSANSLGKIANGLCDNLLTSVVRAWDHEKRLVVCPAMNTYMWRNPITPKQLHEIREIYNAEIVFPKDDHLLACGDVGPGAMADIKDIVNYIAREN
jgi:phosphopantothenoylcysteine decarboxylase